MTVSVKVAVGAEEPRRANFEVQRNAKSQDGFEDWMPAEVGTIEPGTHKVFVMHPGQRVILSE
jgi:hypothetical protein